MESPDTVVAAAPSPSRGTWTRPIRHGRRLLLELVPVALLLVAALPSVADLDALTAAGSLASMVAWCLLPALILLHFLVRSEIGHLVGVALVIAVVVYLLGVGDIEEPLGGLILLQLAVVTPPLALAVAVVDAVVMWLVGRRRRRAAS